MAVPLIHVWERFELTLEAKNDYDNPYLDVKVWIDLEGPNFNKRVFGFWDGGSTFKVRVTAPAAGEWSWHSHASVQDAGLCGERGRFKAINWTQEELAQNACRRGFLQASANGHALNYADGTPCYLIGDTWWATPTYRYRWTDTLEGNPPGPDMGFKDMVAYRKAQGYNCIAMLAAHPAWADDGQPAAIWFDEDNDIGIRDAWTQAGTHSAKDMHNEGGRPFFFPGKVPGYENIVPDFDRINPEYFKYMDRKVDYLNEVGFIPFIEVARRDITSAWAHFYDWPTSYVRYIQYIFSRYQANNVILSPIHYDWIRMSLPSRTFNSVIKQVFETYGPPPFDSLLSANANGSTLLNFDDAEWLGIHQVGNWRNHNSHWLLTEIYQECDPPKPAMNGEPFYDGWADYRGWPDYEGWSIEDFVGGSEKEAANARSGMYGSFLSGGLAGHIYGAEGIWGGDIEAEACYTMWDALKWPSGAQMEYFRDFVQSEGIRYQELVPNANWVYPNATTETETNSGWAYAARTGDRSLFLVYCECGCAQPHLRSAIHHAQYEAAWFNPRTGEWTEAGTINADAWGRINLPALPDTWDWAMKLKRVDHRGENNG